MAHTLSFLQKLHACNRLIAIMIGIILETLFVHFIITLPTLYFQLDNLITFITLHK